MTQTAPDDGFEREILERGSALLLNARPQSPFVLSPDWWQERLLEWAAADPDFRTKLLRFVDVLPTLRTPASVAEHVRQYFRDDPRAPVRLGASAAGHRAFRPVLSRAVRSGVFAMADRFIGAADAEQLTPTLRSLTEAGTAYTVDLLGEATLSEAEADAYLQRYLELINVLARTHDREDPVRRANISLKLSALSPHFEPAAPDETAAALRSRLEAILDAAIAGGVFVNIDMEQYRYRSLVHHITADVTSREPYRSMPHLGVVVQAYLRDADVALADLAATAERRGQPITVRLVKGAYWDEEVALAEQEGREPPVFVDKEATDASYEQCTASLLSYYPVLLPAFGTHNPRSIAQAMARAHVRNVPVEDVEFQMLFGMASELQSAVQASGYRTRVYLPTGAIVPGMAYLVRRLLENTSNESWFLDQSDDAPPEELLRRPEPPEPALRPAPHFVNATPAQFHEAATREAMRRALAEERAAFGQRFPLFYNGREVEADEQGEVRSPAEPGTVLGRVDRADATHVQAAVRVARAALPTWRSTRPGDRAATLRRCADLLEGERFAFAATMVFESGKPWREADGDVCEAIDYLRYYAGEAERYAAGAPLLSPLGERNRYVYEPRGVTVAIAPWNFPLAIITGMTAAALAAGCPVILKPAEQSPILAARLVRLLVRAGVPDGVVGYLPGPGEIIGKALAEHPDVDVIAFTGSNAVGLELLASSATVRPGQRNLKHLVLEMGGKNAVIVDDDADLDQAVDGVIHSAFGYAGQKCSAASRVIVVGSAYPEFRARLAAAVEALVVGAPDNPFSQVPPVISFEARERIQTAIEQATREGTLVARSSAREGPGWYVPPHVFEGIAQSSSLAQEEIFGPLLLLFAAGSFEEALEMAMDSRYALTGGVFSRHPDHIERAIDAFRVGNLYVNRKTTGATVGRQPFGGLGMSGAGDKAGGPDYLLNYLVARTVTENTMRRGFAPTEGTGAQT